VSNQKERLTKKMKNNDISKFQQIIPFVFPTFALLLLLSGLLGTYTIPVFVIVLLFGFAYSFVSMLTKRALVGSIINLYVTGILIFGGALLYIMAIASGV